MLERNVTITYIPVKNSFIYVPKNLDKLSSGTCVKLSYENGYTGYFSVGNSIPTLKDNCIGISSLYCKTLAIEEDESVLLSEILTVPTINSITITPTSESDYDIIETLAENIQSTLLNQIRVVYSGQKFVIWIGNSINVTVIVDEVKPVSPGILGFLTEVHIKPASNCVEKPKPAVNVNFEKIKKGFQNIYSKINIFENTLPKVENGLNKYLNYKHDLVYRLIRNTKVPFYKNIGNYLKPFNVFTTRKNVPTILSQNNFIKSPLYCCMSLITDDVFSNKTIYTRLLVLEDFLDEVDPELNNSIFVDDIIFNYLNCNQGARVMLKFVEKVPFVKEINIHTKRTQINVEHEFKKYLSEHSDQILVLNSDFPLKIGQNIVFSLKFVPIELKFVIVDNDSIRNFKYHIIEEDIALPVNETKEEKFSVDQLLGDILNYPDIIKSTERNFGTGCDRFENVLIIGKPGTGKTTILKCIAEQVQKYPHFIYTKTINCRSFRGKTPDSLIRVLSDTFSTLIVHQPSLLMLDNLHILCEHIPGDETAPNSLYYNRISEMLHNFFKLFSDPNKIGICATTESIEKLNKNLYSSRGSHLFKDLYTIGELNKVDRLNLLQHLFKNHRVNDVNFEDLSVKTEGFVIHDIIDFYNKTLFELYKEADDENIQEITQENVDAALRNTCVLSLQNVNLHSPGDKDFWDVGGLEDVKDVLVESLLWPAKYPNIFDKAPLRLQSGLLLYGPPGTGKTLLAGAAAKHCGLRLISVKGPELLSKYIGASEQAVRDVFQKAQSVRPCILFFDEFDSLAPRRGHDNTGVTDRVVNQLLTQLDGVESLTGVCVLAATSRPDLLDPALLRPGRLDRQLLCDLPDKDGRLAILTVLAKNLDLEDDIDLEKIAVATESYSGADLQSLLYSAQISTIGESWENDEISDEISRSKVTQTHLEDALTKTKPSLTKQERRKYERIYAKFKSGSNIDDFKAGTRATLA